MYLDCRNYEMQVNKEKREMAGWAAYEYYMNIWTYT